MFIRRRRPTCSVACAHTSRTSARSTRATASTDLGKTGDTLLRTILRRGIAFGPPVVGVKKPSAKLWKQERGLMFVCYQASIEDQFEFLVRRWSNSSLQPNLGGHDPVIGQHESYGNRERFIDFPNGSVVGPHRHQHRVGHSDRRRLFLRAPDRGDPNVLGA